MKYKYVLFDLDGTITDPFDGITRSIIYALAKFGISENDDKKLAAFIGPPLVDSFAQYYDFSHGCALAAVGYYREYYAKTGIYECTLYDGIDRLLRELSEQNIKVIMATSKPEIFAKRLMRHFELDGCFNFICGATMDEKRTNKEEVIRYAIEKAGVSDLADCIMVGDRRFDIEGAKAVGIDSIGVSYGYGSESEINAAAPTYIADSVEKLRKILLG